MPILQIAHQVPNYEGWKKTFDSDPLNRKKSGVKRYQVSRPADDPHYVVIDLYFDSLDDAKATLSALQDLWTRVQGTVMNNPKTRILDVVETIEL